MVVSRAVDGRISRNLKEVSMADFILNMFAEIADFFISLWSDKIITKFTPKK